MRATDPVTERLLAAALQRHDLGDAVDADAVPALAAFTALLMQHGKRTNLVGTTDPARLVDEVIADALQAAALLPREGGSLVDVGSGAGIPAIPLAIVRPEWAVTSIEPREKRVLFQRTVKRALGLAQLRIVEGRLGDAGELPAGTDSGFDVAVTKAVWAPDAWVPRGRALVRDGGLVLVYTNEDPAAQPALHALGALRDRRAYALEDGRRRQVLALS